MQVENSPNDFALYCIHQSGGNVESRIQFYVFSPSINSKTLKKQKNILNHNLVTFGPYLFDKNYPIV